MKILYSHLKNFISINTDIYDISKYLFQLGHENEVLEDNVIDIEFTPNKGDCLSVYGIARDLNAILDVNLNLDLYEEELEDLKFNFINEVPEFCKDISFLKIVIKEPISSYKPYLDSYFKDLNIPKKNFFTDVSNYLAYEIGQPTHCYDFQKVKDGFTLSTLDLSSPFNTILEKEINLDQGEYVFIKGDEVINLAGIMGGKNTGCSIQTKAALVECGFFNPDIIIGKSLKYDLVSDAAYKFERGTDINIHETALRRFIKIVQDHAKIESISIKKFSSEKHTIRSIDCDYHGINRVLGTSYSDVYINNILARLGFKINKQFIIPSWRVDIESINDIAEEVARVVGYDNINISQLNAKDQVRLKNINSKVNYIRGYMKRNGFNEVINDPFVPHNQSDSISVINPLDSNRQFLRTNLINSLIKNLDFNEKRQKDSIRLFEISNIYKNGNQITNKKFLSIIISGRQGLDYKNFNKKLDINYLKVIIKNMGLNESHINEINRDSFSSKLKNKIYYVEVEVDDLNIASIEDIKIENNKFEKISKISEFPLSFRDISLSLDNSEILEEVIKSVINIDLCNLKDLFIFDFYHNKEKNILKIGFRFVFQSTNKTLKEIEIDREMKKLYKIIEQMSHVKIPGLNN